MQCYNNRLFKRADGTLELRMASVESQPAQRIDFHDTAIEKTTGDYAPILSTVVRYLKKAQEYALNETEVKYLQEYINSFTDGDLQHHIDGSALWTQDKKTAVENYIGFIENYRDPYGVRGEWEGFVAIMNKKYTKILSDLVDQAPRFLSLLPWGSAFEKVGPASRLGRSPSSSSRISRASTSLGSSAQAFQPGSTSPTTTRFGSRWGSKTCRWGT